MNSRLHESFRSEILKPFREGVVFPKKTYFSFGRLGEVWGQ